MTRRVLANYEVKHSNELPSIEKARLCRSRMTITAGCMAARTT